MSGTAHRPFAARGNRPLAQEQGVETWRSGSRDRLTSTPGTTRHLTRCIEPLQVVFSPGVRELSCFVGMLQNLTIKEYAGFLFLFQAGEDAPKLLSHRHREPELNLVVRGNITYVVGGQRFTFPAGTLLWLFPQQEHQMVDASATALQCAGQV